MRASTRDLAETEDSGEGILEQLVSDVPAAVARLYRRLRAEKPGGQIGDSQLSVLALLVKTGPHALGELSDHEHVTPPSMNQTVNSLAQAGYVTRQGDPDDGRRVILVATPEGVALIEETRRRRHAWLNARLRELSDAEREILATATGIISKIADS
ncbi:MAG TPA: MarR family transcriptional regulator [Solirubrobacteraceae bacterium]|nr:MarR family transcriptional regulator [Solirubrobacteraceae bacterium]